MRQYNALFLTAFAVVAVAIADPAFAQELFKAPASFLQQVKDFVTGANGVLLGGAAVAVLGISAASPRIPVSWGGFFVGVVVLAIFYGAFNIAEVIQGFSK